MILRGYETELDPTVEQRRMLARHVSGSRRAYNWALARWKILSGLPHLVAFLRRLDGRDDRAAVAAWWIGVFLAALHRGELAEPRVSKRKAPAEAGEERPKKKWVMVQPTGPVPDGIAARRLPGINLGDWIHAQLTQEKNDPDSDLHWLTELSAFAVREAVGDVKRAHDAFFRRLKKHTAGDHSECKPRRRGKGCELGAPTWRSVLSRSYHADQPNPIRVRANAVLIPTVGWVRLKEQNYLPRTAEKSHALVVGGKACGIGVSERGGRWYIALRVERPAPSLTSGKGARRGRGPGRALRPKQTPRIPGKVVGVDSGVRYLAVTSDGDRFGGLEDDPELQRLERRRKLWERRMARRWQPASKLGLDSKTSRRDVVKAQSKGWHEARRNVARFHHEIVRVRDDRVAVAVRRILDAGAETIVVRGPQVAKMLARAEGADRTRTRTRNALAPRVHAARMGDLSRRLQYKAPWAGARCIEAPVDYPSTRRCSVCGHVRDDDPGYSPWTCTGCGHVHDRELNAAENLRQLGLPGASGAPTAPEPQPPDTDDYRTSEPSGDDAPVGSGRVDRDKPPQGDNGRKNRKARLGTQVPGTAPDPLSRPLGMEEAPSDRCSSATATRAVAAATETAASTGSLVDRGGLPLRALRSDDQPEGDGGKPTEATVFRTVSRCEQGGAHQTPVGARFSKVNAEISTDDTTAASPADGPSGDRSQPGLQDSESAAE